MAVGSTRGKRRLGVRIRPLMERAGKKAADVAVEVRCSRQTVFRLLAGDNLPRFPTFMAILGVLNATDDERASLVKLWEVADVDPKMIEQAASLPDRYMRFRMDETEAVRERTLDAVIIPGLLQIPEYAAALAAGNSKLIPGESWSAKASAERRDRQGLLWREPQPLKLHALIDELALRRMIDGPEVMRAQLDHLITVMDLPHITVQVIPRTAGAYGALSGPVTILTFPEEDEPDSAYVESLTGLDTVEAVDNVARLSAVWDDVAARALPAVRTAEFIRAVRDQEA